MKIPDANGIVIDGFPRDVGQALSFEDQVSVCYWTHLSSSVSRMIFPRLLFQSLKGKIVSAGLLSLKDFMEAVLLSTTRQHVAVETFRNNQKVVLVSMGCKLNKVCK